MIPISGTEKFNCAFCDSANALARSSMYRHIRTAHNSQTIEAWDGRLSAGAEATHEPIGGAEGAAGPSGGDEETVGDREEPVLEVQEHADVTM